MESCREYRDFGAREKIDERSWALTRNGKVLRNGSCIALELGTSGRPILH